MRYLLGLLYILFFTSNCYGAENENKSDIFKCKNGVLPQSAFIKTTRGKEVVEPDGLISREDTNKLINTKNKCFRITGSELIFLIDKDQAIYKVYTDEYVNPWIMIDFNKSPAPTREFKGVVKGVGKYTYKDGKGFPREIPYMIVIR